MENIDKFMVLFLFGITWIGLVILFAALAFEIEQIKQLLKKDKDSPE